MAAADGTARRARGAAPSAARVFHPELLVLPVLALVFVAVPWLRGAVVSQEGIIPYYVRLSFAANQIGLGRLPSWFPYVLSGTPMLADPPTGLFYPLTMPLAFALPVTDAINAWVLLHLVAAGLSMYLYLGTGSLALSRPSRFLGAAIYMLAATVAGDILAGFVQRLAVYALIPLTLYVAEEIVEGRRVVRAVLLGGGVVACQFLAGDPQTFVYATLVVLAYAGARVAGAARRARTADDSGAAPPGSLRTALLLAAMFGLAAGLAAIQILPTLRFYLLSNRVAFDPDFALLGSIPPIGLVTLIAPHFFGDEVHGLWGEGELRAPDFYVHSSILYVGFFTLALVIVALYARRDRWHVRFFGLLGALVLWLALGRFGYLYRAVIYVPFLRSFRDIEYIATLVPLCAAVLAGIGCERYLEPDSDPSVWRRTSATLAAAVCAAGLLVVVTMFYVWRVRGIILVAYPFIRHLMTGSAVFVLIAFGAAAGLLWLRSRTSTPRRWQIAALLAFVVGDLLRAGLPFVIAGTDMRAWERPDAVTRYLERDPSPHRILGLSERAPLFGIQDAEGEWGLLLSRYSEYTNFLQGFPLDAYVRPGSVHGVIVARVPRGRRPLLDLLNVKYAVSRPAGRVAASLRGRPGVAEPVPGTFVVTNPYVAQRVMDAYAYEVQPDRSAVLRALVRPGGDPRRQIVLEESMGIRPDAGLGGSLTGPSADLRITAYEADRVDIHARFGRTGFLVLNDIYYPAWAATVDGRPVKIYRANYLFRAIVVPAGEHDIRFVYRDRMLDAGAAVSGLTLIAGIIAGAIAWTLGRRRRPGGAAR